MTACIAWHEELADHALGLPARPALDAHLASCVACTTTLAEWRARVEQLDKGVRLLVASEPSPYLGWRVLAEIRSAPARFAWLGRWKTALAILVLVAGLAGLAHAIRGMLERRERIETVCSAVTALPHWRSPTEVLLQSPADALLKTVPRLGESFFEIKPELVESKHEKGGKDEN